MRRFVIVTPCLDAERYINEAIHSVVSQAGSFEIRYHIQDGGSTDGTLALIERWDALLRTNALPLACARLSFTYESGADSGLYDAINRGFARAGIRDDDAMCWINADDVLAPGALASVAEILSSLDHVQWVSGRTAHIDDAGLLIRLYGLRPYCREHLAGGLHDGRFFPLLSQEGTFWTGSLWRATGVLDTRFKLAADYDLWRRFAKHADLYVLNAVLGYFRVHARQKSSDLSSYYGEVDRLADPASDPARAAAIQGLAADETAAGACHFIAHGVGARVTEFRSQSEGERLAGAFAALECDQLDILRHYLEVGVRPDAADAEGTPLYVKCLLTGNLDAFALCASFGLDAAPRESGHVTELLKKALIQAVEKSHTVLAETIAGRAVPLNERCGEKPLPLLMSVYVDNAQITKRLIERGADVNARNEQGSPVLLDAIYLDRPRQVAILVESGADTSVTTPAGLDALAFAESLGREQIARFLREHRPGRGRPAVRGRDQVLDVCICTHNPRRDVLALVMKSIANQDVDKARFRVIVVDNASTPALGREDFRELAAAGVDFRIVPEPRLGNVFSRARAIAESTSDWVLFVDDDNELAADYISLGLRIIRDRPELGCFGGRLFLAPTLAPPKWMLPLLPYLAVRDFGEAEITNVANFWGKWEPATAGGFVHRSVLESYVDRIQNDEKVHELGRKGKRSLNSGEDSLMMWGAHKLGLAASYQPGLKLVHHINPERFHFWYFFRLMLGYGKSNAILDKLYLRANPPIPPKTLLRQLLHDTRSQSWRYAVCLAAYHLGYRAEVRRA